MMRVSGTGSWWEGDPGDGRVPPRKPDGESSANQQRPPKSPQSVPKTDPGYESGMQKKTPPVSHNSVQSQGVSKGHVCTPL